ncbi:MAG: rRNA maturation RNase YbeY [Desulfovibrio sp.]|nr:rRNA maturation RNase YbeY [Desulfovibrio sp.]
MYKGQRRSVSLVLQCHYTALAWLPLNRRQVCKALERMIAVLAYQGITLPGIVEVHLVDDGTISSVNIKNLNCTGPTNVLSFPGADDLPGSLLLSLNTLERECLQYGQKISEHLLRLLAHGMVHLAGFDHGPEMDYLCELCLDAGLAVLEVS